MLFVYLFNKFHYILSLFLIASILLNLYNVNCIIFKRNSFYSSPLSSKSHQLSYIGCTYTKPKVDTSTNLFFGESKLLGRNVLLPEKDVYRGSLSNGLKYSFYKKDTPKVEVYLQVCSGSADENDDQRGMAHLCEHISYMGSKKRSWLSSYPAKTNAYTDFNHTVFYAKTDNNVGFENKEVLLTKMLEALLDVIEAPTQFNQYELDKERKAVFAEAKNITTAQYYKNCNAVKVIHPENVLPKRFPLGDLDAMARYTVEEVKKFHDQHYIPDNTHLYIRGNFEHDVVAQIVNILFSKLENPKNLSQIRSFYKNTEKDRRKGLPPVTHLYNQKEPVFNYWSCDQLPTFNFEILKKMPIKGIRTFKDYYDFILNKLVFKMMYINFSILNRDLQLYNDVTVNNFDCPNEGCHIESTNINCDPDNWKNSVFYVISEIGNILSQKVSTTFLDHTKESVLFDFESVDDEDDGNNSFLQNEIMNRANLLKEDRIELTKRCYEQIEPSSISDRLNKIFSWYKHDLKGVKVLASGPEADIDEEEVKNVFYESINAKVKFRDLNISLPDQLLDKKHVDDIVSRSSNNVFGPLNKSFHLKNFDYRNYLRELPEDKRNVFRDYYFKFKEYLEKVKEVDTYKPSKRNGAYEYETALKKQYGCDENTDEDTKYMYSMMKSNKSMMRTTPCILYQDRYYEDNTNVEQGYRSDTVNHTHFDNVNTNTGYGYISSNNQVEQMDGNRSDQEREQSQQQLKLNEENDLYYQNDYHDYSEDNNKQYDDKDSYKHMGEEAYNNNNNSQLGLNVGVDSDTVLDMDTNVDKKSKLTRISELSRSEVDVANVDNHNQPQKYKDGYELFTLNNNVRVNCKRGEENSIFITTNIPIVDYLYDTSSEVSWASSDSSLEERINRNKLMLILISMSLMESGSMGNLDRKQVEMFCELNSMSVNITQDNDYIRLEIDSSYNSGKMGGDNRNKLMEYSLQILNNVLENHKITKDEFERAKQKLLKDNENYVKDIKEYGIGELVYSMTGGKIGFHKLDLKLLDELKYEDVVEETKKLFENSRKEVNIVSSMSLKKLLPLVTKYLSSSSIVSKPKYRMLNEDELKREEEKYNNSSNDNNNNNNSRQLSLNEYLDNNEENTQSTENADSNSSSTINTNNDNMLSKEQLTQNMFMKNRVELFQDVTDRAIVLVGGHAPNSSGYLPDGRHMSALMENELKNSYDNMDEACVLRRELWMHPAFPRASADLFSEALSSDLFSKLRTLKNLTYDTKLDLFTNDINQSYYVINTFSNIRNYSVVLSEILEYLKRLYSLERDFSKSFLDSCKRTVKTRIRNHGMKYYSSMMSGIQLPEATTKNILSLTEYENVLDSITSDDFNLMLASNVYGINSGDLWTRVLYSNTMY